MTEQEPIRICDHLDRPIIELAKNFARLQIVTNPDFSCSGHLTDNRRTFGDFAGFENGYWPFALNVNDPRAPEFYSALQRLVSEFPATELREDGSRSNTFSVGTSFATCDGLIMQEAESLSEALATGNRNRIPIEAGIDFYERNFKGFWDQFNQLVISFLNENESDRRVICVSDIVREGVDQTLLAHV